MVKAFSELRSVLSAMDYMVVQDEAGDLPHDIDFHFVMREMIKGAKLIVAESLVEKRAARIGG